MLNRKLFHTQYVAHVLNLMVNEDLNIIGIGIKKIRESVSYWLKKPSRVEKFEDIVCSSVMPSMQ